MSKRREKRVHLGALQSGNRVYLKPEDRRTHMHVIGASGRGKSYFLEYLIRQDIRNGDGVCLLDPHGTLYHNIVAWCAQQHPDVVNWDKLILLDASDPDSTFGFNPLNFGAADTSYAVDSMVNAVAQVWGGEDTASTPRLKGVLRGVFHALAENNLTLLEAEYLINEREEWKPIRKALTDGLRDGVMREQWARWNEYKPHEYREQFASTTNRIMEFISAEAVRAIVGQQEWVMDFRKVMDEGWVVLVNLEPRGRFSDFNAQMLGTLITNDLFLKAQGRPEGSKPFYFYIDECGRYLNESIQRILDESRKRGLHLILAHQHLAQLREAGERVYGAVMTNTHNKVVFGGLWHEDADTMVKQVFLDLDLEEPKRSLNRMAAVGQELVSLRSGGMSRSTTSGTATTEGESRSRTSTLVVGASESESETTYPDDEEGPTTEAWGMNTSTSESEGYTSSSSTTTSESESIAEMNGWTESFKTIYQEVVGGVHTLEEQRYKKAAWLKKQPVQMALYVDPKYALVPFRVPDLKLSTASAKRRKRFVAKRIEAIPCVRPRSEALWHIEARALEIKKQGIPTRTPIPELAEEDFRDNG